MIVDNGKYYLYRHIRLDTNQPFYIGIGTKPFDFVKTKEEYVRAYTKSSRGIYWRNIVNKVGYRVEILLETNDYAFLEQKEVEFIELYGRKIDGGILCNIENGGKTTLRTNIKYNIFNLKKELIYKNVTKKDIWRIFSINRSQINTHVNKKILYDYEYYIIRTDDKITKFEDFRYTRKNRRVIELTLNGVFVKEWLTSLEICNYYKINKEALSACLKSITYSTNGRIFIYKDSYDLTKNYSKKDSKCTPVKISNVKTNEIFIFDSAKEAAKYLGISSTNMYHHSKNIFPYKKTYIITYLNKN